MKFVVLDVQGYSSLNFIAKELCIVDRNIQNTYLLKPPCNYNQLADDVKKEVSYMERFHHKIKFSSGDILYEEIRKILYRDIIYNKVDVVYVKGNLKKKFLVDNLVGENHSIDIINLEDCFNVPKFTKNLPIRCLNHQQLLIDEGRCICALENATMLYKWVTNSLSI